MRFWSSMCVGLALAACTLEPADGGKHAAAARVPLSAAAPAEGIQAPGNGSAAPEPEPPPRVEPTAPAPTGPPRDEPAPSPGDGAEAKNELVYRNEESGCWDHDEESSSILVTDAALAELRDAALTSRAVTTFAPALLGITAASLDENRPLVIDALERLARADEGTLYDRMIERAGVLLTFDYVQGAVLRRMRRHDHSTEKTLLEVTLPGKPAITLSTHHRVAYMLPWTVRSGKKSWATYSTALPLALAKVLPRTLPSHGQLDGRRYWSDGFWSDENVWYPVWETLHAEPDPG